MWYLYYDRDELVVASRLAPQTDSAALYCVFGPGTDEEARAWARTYGYIIIWR